MVASCLRQGKSGDHPTNQEAMLSAGNMPERRASFLILLPLHSPRHAAAIGESVTKAAIEALHAGVLRRLVRRDVAPKDAPIANLVRNGVGSRGSQSLIHAARLETALRISVARCRSAAVCDAELAAASEIEVQRLLAHECLTPQRAMRTAAGIDGQPGCARDFPLQRKADRCRRIGVNGGKMTAIRKGERHRRQRHR
jgi:hypothetical protein